MDNLIRYVKNNKNDKIITIIKTTHNIDLYDLIVRAIYFKNYELVKILYFEYNIQINFYPFILREFMFLLRHDTFLLKFCLKNNMINKKIIYHIRYNYQNINCFTHTQDFEYEKVIPHKTYVFDIEKIYRHSDVNITHKLLKYFLSNSNIVFLGEDPYYSYIGIFEFEMRIKNYFTIKVYDTFKMYDKDITKINFIEFLKTHKNINSSLNIVFFNLYKYIIEFL